MSFIFYKLFYKCCCLKPISDRVQQPDVIPRLMRPLVGIPEHTAIESKARSIHMKPSLPLVPLVRVPSYHLAVVTNWPFQKCLALAHAQHCDWPGAKTPYAAKLMEEVKGIHVVLLGEVDEAVDAVVLDVVERRVPLAPQAALRRVLGRPSASIGRVAVGGGEVAVHEAAAAEQVRGLARGGAAVDDEPEQRLGHEAEGVREAVQVVRLQRARAGRRHDDQGRRRRQRQRRGGLGRRGEREVVEVEVEVAVREGEEAGDEAEEEAEDEARRREGPPRRER